MQQHNKLHYVNKAYQTEAYQLNIIEKDDTFSPDPLNENMEKLDNTLLAAHMGAVAEHDQRNAADAALDQRVTALEAKKMVVGTYIGNAQAHFPGIYQIIELGFSPITVIVFGDHGTMALPNCPGISLELTETGFQVHNSNSGGMHLNVQSRTYCYIAFG